MNHFPKCYGIIPARYRSKRFPGKPLVEIFGKPMFWHVFMRAKNCPDLLQVILATDDERIAEAAKVLDVPVVMTRDDHPSGTDRVQEAAQILQIPSDAVVMNIQGDEPAIKPEMLSELVRPFQNPHVKVTTLARSISFREAQNTDRVKVVFTCDGRALYFSRSIIPFSEPEQEGSYFGHIGLYAFRMSILNHYVGLNQSGLEEKERLEQLRLLEHNIPIHVVQTNYKSIGVDRPGDVPAVSKLMLDNDEEDQINQILYDRAGMGIN